MLIIVISRTDLWSQKNLTSNYCNVVYEYEYKFNIHVYRYTFI